MISFFSYTLNKLFCTFFSETKFLIVHFCLSHNNSETEWSTKSSLRTRAESENEDEDAEKEEDDLDKASENIPSGMITMFKCDQHMHS